MYRLSREQTLHHFSEIKQFAAELWWYKDCRFGAVPTVDFTVGGFQSWRCLRRTIMHSQIPNSSTHHFSKIRLSRLSYSRASNETVFVRGEWAELHIWPEHFNTISHSARLRLTINLLDFRYVALFQNQGALNWTGVENFRGRQSNFALFSPL